jgi:hypothetical protein
MLAGYHTNDIFLIIVKAIRHPTGEVPPTAGDTFYDGLSFSILEVPTYLPNTDQFM